MNMILQNWQAILAIIAAIVGLINLIAHFILNAEHKDHQLVTDDIATWLTQAKGAIDRGTVTPRLPPSIRDGVQSVQYQQEQAAIPPPPTNRGYMKFGLISILLTCALATVFACAAFQVDSAKLAADEIDCAKQAIADKLPVALPEIASALAGQNSTDALAKTAVAFGADVVTCGVAVYVRDEGQKASAPLSGVQPSGFKADTAADSRALTLTNGRIYLAAQTRKPMLK